MKKKKWFAAKPEKPEQASVSGEGISKEETLDIDNLLEVQGGIEDEKDVKENCGLGCFSGAVLTKGGNAE